MENHTKDLTVGSPSKVIIKFSLPIILSLLFQSLYNVVDSIIVGNFLGDDPLSAVASSGNFIFLFTSFFFGLAMGCGALIGKYFGEKNQEQLTKSIHSAIVIGLIGSVILTTLAETLSPALLKLMGTPDDVIVESISYFRGYFIGGIGLVMYSMLNAILQAVGNSRRGLYYLIISSVLNVCLDLLFIGPFNMGVFGAGLASAISQIFSATLAFIFLMKKGTVFQVEIRKVRLHSDVTKQMIYLGVPSGIQNSVIAIANICVQSFINSFGDYAIAGCGTYSKLESFAFVPINAFTSAITNFVSQNLGAGKFDRAKQGARFGILVSLLMSETIGLILFITAPYLIRIFTSTQVCIDYGTKYARTTSLFFFLLAYSHCVSSVCRGGGKPIIPMLVMLIDWCVFRVIFINIMMAQDHNIEIIMWAYPLTWGISSIFYVFYYYLSDWVHGYDKNKILVHVKKSS